MRWLIFALFILGTHVPLPKDLVWRSREVESAIGRSNEVLGAYSVSLRVDQEDALQSKRDTLKEVLPLSNLASRTAMMCGGPSISSLRHAVFQSGRRTTTPDAFQVRGVVPPARGRTG